MKTEARKLRAIIATQWCHQERADERGEAPHWAEQWTVWDMNTGDTEHGRAL